MAMKQLTDSELWDVYRKLTNVGKRNFGAQEQREILAVLRAIEAGRENKAKRLLRKQRWFWPHSDERLSYATAAYRELAAEIGARKAP